MTDTISKAGYEGEAAMLDKVARAICGASCFRARILGEPCLNDDRTNGPCKANTTQLELGGPMDAAHRALEALKDPDVLTRIEMMQAFSFDKAPHEAMRDAFNAAIDHILKGGEA